MQFDSLQELQAHLRSFTDPSERRIAEAAPFFSSAQSTQAKHIVVLLHGMNSNAEWQEALADAVRNSTNIEPRVVGYGNFHPVKFFIPWFFRRGRIKRVLTDLAGLRERNPDAQISIVAHSFGTYVLSKILASSSDLRFHRILLCGAIIDTDYDWNLVSKKFSEPVINDIGRRDIWPSMAKSWSWGYGNSGCVGFKNSLVRDRHFTYKHSGFLNWRHMRRYWLPYLLDGKVVTPRYTRIRKQMPLLESSLRSFSWFYIIIALIIWAIVHWRLVPICYSHVVNWVTAISSV